MTGVLNLTAELERLVADIALQMEPFRHLDPERLMICISSTRGGGVHGTYAKIHPLRFAGGVPVAKVRRRGRIWTCTMPTVTRKGQEVLYVIYFLSPRFFNLSLREKLITVFHELYHISPEFNGDIRRFPGRNYAHGSSTRAYNLRMGEMVDAYLDRVPDPGLLRFLEGTMDEIRNRYAAVVGRTMAAPRVTMTKG
jgi:hypothetical protein